MLSVTNITKLERLHRATSRAITGCLSFSPIPLLLSDASLPLLRVILTNFTFSSYERALRLPTSFPISGLARLGVKPRLYRSIWRPFASIHPLMLPSTSPRRLFLLALPFLFGIFPRSQWGPPFPLHALALVSFFLSKVRLSLTLTLFFFDSFGKGGWGAFANCSLYDTEATLCQQAQYVQVFLLKPAPFRKLLASFGRTNKFAIFLLFSSDMTHALSSSPCLLHLCFYLNLWQIWQELLSLSSCSIRLQWAPKNLFLPGNDTVDELARR